MKDTIASIATPLISSAIHIVRICGPESYPILKKITKNKIVKKGYEIQKCIIWDKNEIIDDAILVKFVAPRSYNGEDIIEINCHGGPLVTKKILSILLENGARLSENGEFTKIAFLNNKLTLNQSIAANNLINAKTENARKIAVNSLFNDNSSTLNNIANILFQVIGKIEVNIDYPEYDDVEQIVHKSIFKEISNVVFLLEKILEEFIISEKIFKGFNVAIIGKPNVGKSSLLNAFLKEERAIVSNIAGTTRDFVSESIIVKGILINIIDTAGIRDSNNKIEKIGVKKTFELVDKADLLLFVIDNSKPISKEEIKFLNDKKLASKKIILVKNKSDIAKNYNDDIHGILVSAKKIEIGDLFLEIEKELSFGEIDNLNSVISTQDQSSYIKNVINILNNVLKQVNKKDPIDLIVIDIQQAHSEILKILGKYDDFDFYNELFKNFCLGK
ncbi:MAG: tRNA uridine-5-carboxymethylaminomethyl(34) synthesis GTPase MnmE [Malacoplasma sp.]